MDAATTTTATSVVMAAFAASAGAAAATAGSYKAGGRLRARRRRRCIGASRAPVGVARTGVPRCGSGAARRATKEPEEALDEDTYFPFLGYDEPPGDELEEGNVGGADDEICEIIGYDMGDGMRRSIGTPFSEEERQAAYKAAGLFDSSPSMQPQAIWLIGPSASGKSTLAPRSAEWVGIVDEGFVEVDGEYFRDSHAGYQEALRQGAQRGCVWWGAYTGIRENVNKEKQQMLQRAAEEQKHLVIPSTCLRKSQCVDVAELLLKQGYTLHVVGIYGEKEEITKRGRKRALLKGKRYNPNEFGLALKMFAPMLRRCNGHYYTICSTAEDPFAPTDSGSGPLEEAEIERICGMIFNSYSGQDHEELAAVLPLQQANGAAAAA